MLQLKAQAEAAAANKARRSVELSTAPREPLSRRRISSSSSLGNNATKVDEKAGGNGQGSLDSAQGAKGGWDVEGGTGRGWVRRASSGSVTSPLPPRIAGTVAPATTAAALAAAIGAVTGPDPASGGRVSTGGGRRSTGSGGVRASIGSTSERVGGAPATAFASDGDSSWASPLREDEYVTAGEGGQSSGEDMGNDDDDDENERDSFEARALLRQRADLLRSSGGQPSAAASVLPNPAPSNAAAAAAVAAERWYRRPRSRSGSVVGNEGLLVRDDFGFGFL